ncbi:LysR family transcriptional regulator [Jeotgalicoccus aerolatus]|uniref:DNA-binding transcriptional LysR family regulator n=1 Tax=Jeotgalicoccus aerolatus TaxID=709510 RepID=A0ABS4HMT3_9STAP|nr:LysR family transcriptional regulator [Jeotgalicoccus aerolatus]MBP1952239.1 DNA-binding transcriptional LysR family regulator [Jeotgalicoccus aerolatus]NMA81012.1 LysR family transcriptional regulator [Jeotgalicoccus aerolatus]
MDEKDWKLLVNLYAEKNITKTAKKLYISQPSLTYRIKQLEKEFGITLLHRGNKGITFTSEGEYLVKYAEKMLSELRQAEDALANMNNQLQGTLRLGSSSNFAHYELPSILEGFIYLYPDIDVQLKTGWSTDILELLQSESIHAAFIRGDIKWSGEKMLLSEERMSIVSKHEINLGDLPQLNYIKYDTDQHLKTTLDNWWIKTFDVPAHVSMEVDRIETCKEMVKKGLGFSVMPNMSLRGEDDLYTKEIKIDGQPVTRQSWLLYKSDMIDLKIVESLSHFVKQYYNLDS